MNCLNGLVALCFIVFLNGQPTEAIGDFDDNVIDAIGRSGEIDTGENAINADGIELIIREIRRKLEFATEAILDAISKITCTAPTGAPAPSIAPRRGCPSGFNNTVDGPSKCYAVVDERLTWDDAQSNCRQLHPEANLAIINSYTENEAVRRAIGSRECRQENHSPDGEIYISYEFWLGGAATNIFDCKSPFVWKLRDGGVLSFRYTNWFRDEPNCAYGGEACMSIMTRHGFKWNDMMCSWTVCSVCEVIKQV